MRINTVEELPAIGEVFLINFPQDTDPIWEEARVLSLTDKEITLNISGEVLCYQLSSFFKDVLIEKLPADERNTFLPQVLLLRQSNKDLRRLCNELINHLRYNRRESTEVLDEFWNKEAAIAYVPVDPKECSKQIKIETIQNFITSLGNTVQPPQKPLSGSAYYKAAIRHVIQYATNYIHLILKGELK